MMTDKHIIRLQIYEDEYIRVHLHKYKRIKVKGKLRRICSICKKEKIFSSDLTKRYDKAK